MAWIKQDDGTYIKQETTEIVNVDELKRKIEKIKEDIVLTEKELLEYPENVSDKIKEAIDLWNETNIFPKMNLLLGELSEFERILNEIENGNKI